MCSINSGRKKKIFCFFHYSLKNMSYLCIQICYTILISIKNYDEKTLDSDVDRSHAVRLQF